MYAWLTDALRGSSQIVTAKRRLARVLATEFGKQQLASGSLAWRSPEIRSWQDWLNELLQAAELSQPLPTRINSHQSRVLWERCLRREVSDPLLNIAMLVRQARESWTRLHEFAVPFGECKKHASGKDQKLFARAATNYQSILDREHWVDEAGLAGLLTRLVGEINLALPDRVTVAGFNRLTPQVTQLLDKLRATGVNVETMSEPRSQRHTKLHSYDNSDAELRAAGAWARKELQKSPGQTIAIVATHLEQNAVRCARLVREGLAPGWQTAGVRHRAAVNVSYGQTLNSYAAIAIALLVLRWVQNDLPSRDVSTLLRAAAIGSGVSGDRSRLDIGLRQVPDRNWTPAMLARQLTGGDATRGARNWLGLLKTIDRLRKQLPRRAAPTEWAVLVDDVLNKLNWPGAESLNSFEFQLVNRWRELLNDLARLQLVSPTMTFAQVLNRLVTMASETVFQPESERSIVQLLGPLEAAGMRFDKLWITGVSAANWPQAARPASLVARKIQRDYGMPDADPADTLDFSRRVLQRLVRSAKQVTVSYPLTDGDAEQTESGLLAELATRSVPSPGDPGWYATQLVGTADIAVVAMDKVPPVAKEESISGGAATIDRQLREPFAAFAFGRLGIRSLPGIVTGLAPIVRGNLIHEALRSLYSDRPTQDDIKSWTEDESRERIAVALQKAFGRHERTADPVLLKIFKLEQRRVAELLRKIVAIDKQRQPFRVDAVEASVDAAISGLQLALRIDRIDRFDDDTIEILDYKTGMCRPFLDSSGNPNDMQLVVYACAVEEPVAGLGLLNIDSRSIDFDGVGRDLTPELNWQDVLSNWKGDVIDAASEIQHGDVRINGLQNTQTARPLSLLSRIAELRRDA